jgi:hypothetical protein
LNASQVGDSTSAAISVLAETGGVADQAFGILELVIVEGSEGPGVLGFFPGPVYLEVADLALAGSDIRGLELLGPGSLGTSAFGPGLSGRGISVRGLERVLAGLLGADRHQEGGCDDEYCWYDQLLHLHLERAD